MEADTIEYGECKTGLRTEGTTYAILSFARKLAQALGGALGVWVIGWFGYQAGAVEQSDGAMFGTRFGVGVVPAVFFASAVLMQSYPMSVAPHREIVAELKARNNDGGSLDGGLAADRSAIADPIPAGAAEEVPGAEQQPEDLEGGGTRSN